MKSREQRARAALAAAGGAGAIAPNGKLVESVWDFPRPPRVETVDWRIRVVHGGQTIVDAPLCVRVLETSQAPAYYVADEFVVHDFLVPSARSSMCEWKGAASYADVVVEGRRAAESCWTYRSPTVAFEPIRDHWAFYAQTLDECWVDDERVDGNEGSFYGGWITGNVTGPYKGGTGTMFW